MLKKLAASLTAFCLCACLLAAPVYAWKNPPAVQPFDNPYPVEIPIKD